MGGGGLGPDLVLDLRGVLSISRCWTGHKGSRPACNKYQYFVGENLPYFYVNTIFLD